MKGFKFSSKPSFSTSYSTKTHSRMCSPGKFTNVSSSTKSLSISTSTFSKKISGK